MRFRVLPLVVLAAMLILLVPGTAIAANLTLFLEGEGTPDGSLSTAWPPDQELIDFDGSNGPGRMIQKGDGGSCESHSGKYQQWVYRTAGMRVTASKITIWARAKDGKGDKAVRMAVYVIDSGLGCSKPLDSTTLKLNQAYDWAEVSLSVNLKNHEFAPGSELIVKVVVPRTSDYDMEFAYGTEDYPANLRITSPAPTTTTTSKPRSTTTTGATTTTTLARVTTTVPSVATTTTRDDTGSVLGGGGPTPPGPRMVRMSGAEIGSSAAMANIEASLRPQEGLMVGFSAATETIQFYWQAAAALGVLMTLLLSIGFRRMADGDTGLLARARLARLKD